MRSHFALIFVAATMIWNPVSISSFLVVKGGIARIASTIAQQRRGLSTGLVYAAVPVRQLRPICRGSFCDNGPSRLFASYKKAYITDDKSTSVTPSQAGLNGHDVGDNPIMSSAPSLRINACFPHLSRRAADKLISSGRVSVNGALATSGMRLHLGDVLMVDNRPIEWSHVLDIKTNSGRNSHSSPDVTTTTTTATTTTSDSTYKHLYIKLWKPRGVECTANPSIRNNVMSRFGFNRLQPRVFTVGRLDKDSSGLLLLTSDGAWANTITDKSSGITKRYEVETSSYISDDMIRALREGVVIPLEKRNSKGEIQQYMFKTPPCRVERCTSMNKSDRSVVMELTEGKNRQIRRMVQAVGGGIVQALHRTHIGNIDLSGLNRSGDWDYIRDKREL